MINLNDEEFDAKVAKIFNNGVAGRTKCVFDSVVPKAAEDKERAPDYKVMFADATGAKINVPFWALRDTTHEHYQKNLVRDGKKLKSLVHAICGPATAIPQAETAEALLQACMGLINSKAGSEVFLMTTYGTDSNPSQYLNIRNFAPFVEPGNTTEADSKLKFTNFEMQVKIEGTDGSSQDGSSTDESVDWAE